MFIKSISTRLRAQATLNFHWPIRRHLFIFNFLFTQRGRGRLGSQIINTDAKHHKGKLSPKVDFAFYGRKKPGKKSKSDYVARDYKVSARAPNGGKPQFRPESVLIK